MLFTPITTWLPSQNLVCSVYSSSEKTFLGVFAETHTHTLHAGPLFPSSLFYLCHNSGEFICLIWLFICLLSFLTIKQDLLKNIL